MSNPADSPKRQTVELAVDREKVKFISEFTQNMSHDFRTPLTTISTSAHLLAHTDDPARKEKYHRAIEKQVQHLNGLIDNLFTMTRLDSGVDVVMSPINLNQLLHRWFQEWHPLDDRKKLTLKMDFEMNIPQAWADEAELRLAMQHLYRNAWQHTADGGSITVHTGYHQEMISIAIEDTGIGISQADLVYIFNRFYRSDKARNTDTGGTGLGLSIVKKIAEMHGGSIEARSEIGVGSTFCLYIRPVA